MSNFEVWVRIKVAKNPSCENLTNRRRQKQKIILVKCIGVKNLDRIYNGFDTVTCGQLLFLNWKTIGLTVTLLNRFYHKQAANDRCLILELSLFTKIQTDVGFPVV